MQCQGRIENILMCALCLWRGEITRGIYIKFRGLSPGVNAREPLARRVTAWFSASPSVFLSTTGAKNTAPDFTEPLALYCQPIVI